MASLAGISQGARHTFLISEAEYYMQIANAQLQLANNPELATLALRMADERVTQLADPALTDVRRSLADELAALEVMEKPDLEGATLTLASLARVVESLPLADLRQQPAETAEADEEQGNLGAAWSSVKDAMSGLVKVTPPGEARLAVLSPDAESFLRTNHCSADCKPLDSRCCEASASILQKSSLNDSSRMVDDLFRSAERVLRLARRSTRSARTRKAAMIAAESPDISDLTATVAPVPDTSSF